jgi:hypothetical protein
VRTGQHDIIVSSKGIEGVGRKDGLAVKWLGSQDDRNNTVVANLLDSRYQGTIVFIDNIFCNIFFTVRDIFSAI